MNPSAWISLLALIATLFLAIWGVLRKNNQQEARAQWAKIDQLEKTQQALQTEVAVLRQALQAIPDRDHLDDRFQALEDRLQKRVESLGRELTQVLLDAARRAWSSADGVGK